MRRLPALAVLNLAFSFAAVASATVYIAGEDASVSAIDEGTFQVTRIPVGFLPTGIGVNAVTNRIYSANTFSDTVSVIDGATNAVIATIAVGIQPRRIGVDESTNRIYVSNALSGTVMVIHGATNAVIATIPVGNDPHGIAVNSSTSRAYVANFGSSSVSVIDTKRNTVVQTIAVGPFPIGAAFNLSTNPNTNRIYVAGSGDFTVKVIDGATNLVVATIPLAGQPYAVAVNPNTNRIYAVEASAASLAVIDGATNTILVHVPVGSRPFGVAVNPIANRVYVSNWDDDNVMVLDGMTNAVTGVVTLPFGPRPNDAAGIWRSTDLLADALAISPEFAEAFCSLSPERQASLTAALKALSPESALLVQQAFLSRDQLKLIAHDLSQPAFLNHVDQPRTLQAIVDALNRNPKRLEGLDAVVRPAPDGLGGGCGGKPGLVEYPESWGKFGLTGVEIPPNGAAPSLHFAPPPDTGAECAGPASKFPVTLTSEIKKGACSIEVFDGLVPSADGSPLHTRQDFAGIIEDSFQFKYAKLIVVEECDELKVEQVFRDTRITVNSAQPPFPDPATLVPDVAKGTRLRDGDKDEVQSQVRPLPTGKGFAYLDLPGTRNFSNDGPLLLKVRHPTTRELVAIHAKTGATITFEDSYTTLLECVRKSGNCFFIVEWEEKVELVLGDTPEKTTGKISGKVTKLTELHPKSKPDDQKTIDTIRNTTATFRGGDPRKLADP